MLHPSVHLRWWTWRWTVVVSLKRFPPSGRSSPARRGHTCEVMSGRATWMKMEEEDEDEEKEERSWGTL